MRELTNPSCSEMSFDNCCLDVGSGTYASDMTVTTVVLNVIPYGAGGH